MHDNKNQKAVQQQKIKNRLCNIELEESQITDYHYQHSFLHKRIHNKHSDYREISDWTTHQDVHQQLPSLPLPLPLPYNKPEHDTKRFTFFSNKRYQSSLLSPKNNKSPRLQLSPIVVRFNAKVLSQNLQKSKEKFMRKLKEDPYMSHYESVYLLYEQRSKRQSASRYVQLQLGQVKASGSEMHPKTQRLSSILRLMKKQESVRMKSRRLGNPQNLVTTQLKI